MLEPDLVRAAQELATSDAVEEILNRLEAQYTQSWKNTAPDRPDEREQCFRMILAVDALRNEIKSLAMKDRVTAFNNRRLAADTRTR